MNTIKAWYFRLTDLGSKVKSLPLCIYGLYLRRAIESRHVFNLPRELHKKRTTSSHKNLELSLAKAKITSNEKQTLLWICYFDFKTHKI